MSSGAEGLLVQVREAVASALGASPGEIEDDENLFALGVDSMLLIRLAAE